MQGLPRLWRFVAGNVRIPMYQWGQPLLSAQCGCGTWAYASTKGCISLQFRAFFWLYFSVHGFTMLHDFAWQSIISSYMIYMVKKYIDCTAQSGSFLHLPTYPTWRSKSQEVSYDFICISYVSWSFYREISGTEVYSLHLARSPRRPRRTQLAYVGRGMKRWAHCLVVQVDGLFVDSIIIYHY